MKRVGYLIEKIADLDNLYEAYVKACRGKRNKREVVEFGENLDVNIRKIRKGILAGEIEVGNYSYFKIYDPKLRTICAAVFSERVLHHAIMNVCHQYFDRVLIADTYATRPGKGVYSALEKASKGIAHYEWVAKLDVRKYFDSICHKVLKAKLRRIFKDEALLKLFDKIINSYSVSEGRGVPIGNLTSQYFANFYLSQLDHTIKEVLRVPIYVRYMDDMLIFGESKEQIAGWLHTIREKCAELGLELKMPVVVPACRGVSFLGYKLLPYRLLLNRQSKVRYTHKITLYTNYLTTGVWSQQRFAEHVTPLLAFVCKASSFRFRECINRRVIIEGGLQPRAAWG